MMQKKQYTGVTMITPRPMPDISASPSDHARARTMAKQIVHGTKPGPVWQKRIGGLQVAVWENEFLNETNGEVNQYFSISFERRYKDKQGQWASTHSLRVSDLPKVQLLLSEAYKELMLQEDEA